MQARKDINKTHEKRPGIKKGKRRSNKRGSAAPGVTAATLQLRGTHL
jgi:hypothetical protein